MSKNTIQATKKGAFVPGSSFFNKYNSFMAHPIVRRIMRFAILKHTGRRSGRVYTIPVGARPTSTGFVVPLTFGEKSDWYKNVQAANGCVIQWKGIEYRLIDPQIISAAVALQAFNPVERLALQIVMHKFIGVKSFIQFRYAPTGGENAHLETASPRNAHNQ